MAVRKESADSMVVEACARECVKTEMLTHPERDPPRPANCVRSRLVSSLLSATMT
jgi:hypothetical protein